MYTLQKLEIIPARVRPLIIDKLAAGASLYSGGQK